jgi:hypothetical protein
MLNTLFFSQAFFIFFPGIVPNRKSFRGKFGRHAPAKSQPMTHPRLYKRIKPSGRMSATGQIVVGPKLPVLTCKVVDYSAGGACLEICGLAALPDRFEFLYGGVKKKSRIVWRRGIRIGVVF